MIRIYLYEVINKWGLVCFHTETKSNFDSYCEGLKKQNIPFTTNIK